MTAPSVKESRPPLRCNTSLKYTLLFLFSLICAAVVILSQINVNQRVSLAVNTHLQDLQAQFDVIDRFHRYDAQIIFNKTQNDSAILEILEQIPDADEEKRNVLRDELYDLLKQDYAFMKLRGVLQYHFVLPDNTTFLRMHKPAKYGDNLEAIRFSFSNTNENHELTVGFEQGRTTHAFRNTYPIWGNDGTYLCALDIGYGSETIQDLLTEISKLHTHFLVHKRLFSVKAWERMGSKLEYIQSIENDDFMFAVTNQHTPDRLARTKQALTKSHQEELQRKMDAGLEFGIYFVQDGQAVVAAFMPIRNIREKKVVAYLVSYDKDSFIDVTLFAVNKIRTLMCLLFALLFYVIYRNICAKRTLKVSNNELFSQKQLIEEANTHVVLQNEELTKALADVKTLSGFLPICASCKKVRDDRGYWNQIESYIKKHSMVEFSHGICPECVKELYPDLDVDDVDEE